MRKRDLNVAMADRLEEHALKNYNAAVKQWPNDMEMQNAFAADLADARKIGHYLRENKLMLAYNKMFKLDTAARDGILPSVAEYICEETN